MDVILDGQPLSGEVLGENLQQILQFMNKHFIAADRSLQEVLINGKPYVETEMGHPQAISRDSIGTLTVETISARKMAMHFLTSADPTLETLIQAAPMVSEMLRAGETQKANEKYLQFLNTLQLFLQMVEKSSDVLGLDVEGSRIEETSSKESLARLSGLISQLLEAQDKEDWLSLADILEYDLAPELNTWRELLPLIARETS